MEDVQTKGMNTEFGFHVNRPFYFRSRLPMKRVVEVISANNIVLKRSRAKVAAQQFVFDGISKLIKSNHWKNYCLEIQGKGASTNMHVTATCNARWW